MDFRLFDFQTKDENGKFIIEMFGINEKGETSYIKIDDFKPFFYVLVDDSWNNQKINNFIKTKIEPKVKNAINLIKGELCEYNKLYWFSNNKKNKFLRLIFNNMSTYYKVRNIFYNENGKKQTINYEKTLLEIYETKIPPLLRFFHIFKISPSGWISLNKFKELNENVSTCDYEYICSKKHITPIIEKEKRVPYKIASFDIEASSSHGDFPLPVKTYKKLATQIVDLIEKYISNDDDNLKYRLKRMIMAAFSYEKDENIDKVYPKIIPKKDELISLIDNFLNNPITIDKNFDLLSKSENMLLEWNNKNNEEENNNEIDDLTEINELDIEINDFQINKKKESKVKNTYYIIDILKNKNQKREYKITELNKSLMCVLPELEGDKVTFIGTTFLYFGENEPYMNNCLVLGSCDKINGIDIESYDKEEDLLLRWTQLIQEENPDIIIGYNIFGFDYEFLYQRACQNNIEMEFLELSRKKGDICAKFDGYDECRNIIGIESTKVVLASGEYDLRYIKMPGRLQIDMYAYLRRDFNLSSYKLDDVAGQFICDDIKKIEYNENNNTILITNNLTGIHIGDYIHILIIDITTNYIENGKKYNIIDIKNNQIIIKEKLDEKWLNIKLKWGIAKDDVSPQDIFRLTNGNSSDRAKIAKYCIQDCNLVHNLLKKIDVITGYIEMSNICNVPISFLVFRGQGIKLTSYVAKKCLEKDTLIPDLDLSYENDDGYEGAIVLPPKCSMYMDNPVACVDYASLYPSSMISNNLSPDSKLWTKEYDMDGNLIKENYDIKIELPDGYDYVDVEFDTFKWRKISEKSRSVKVKTGKKICRFVQYPDGKRAILPSILEELLKARADTRKRIKNEKDEFMKNILDKRQLAYKMTANSLYGQCGSKTSTFFEKDVAASTTSTGRLMITYAKRIIEEVYGDLIYNTQNYGPVCCNAEYVYGDTDSVFFTFNLKSIKGENIRGKIALDITIEIAQDVANLCSSFLKSPMELTYEKTLMPFILLSKKRYVGMLYENDSINSKLKYMGLSIKRRDSCDYLKDVYGNILSILMKEQNIITAVEFLRHSLKQLINGNVPLDKLIITKALRSDYKNPELIAHCVLANRISERDPGNKPKSGDRIKYLYIIPSNKEKNLLMGNRIETPEFIISNNINIDYTYYITNQLMNPITQLFGLALNEIYGDKKNNLINFNNIINDLKKKFNDDIEGFNKQKEKYCSRQIENIIFEPILKNIQNKNNRQNNISNIFIKKSSINHIY